ncbi:cysteine protease, putative, partial [Trichomonas vaginalis G3]
MFDWFDEPIVYYRRFAPMRSGVFDYMSRWMDSVDREMEEAFGDFYDAFTRRQVPHDMIEDGNKKENKKGASKKGNEKPKKETKHEEKEAAQSEDEVDDEENPQYYSITSSMYSGSDGIQHMHREEVDSKSGLRKVVDTKRIGNKSVTVHEVTDKDGKVEKHQTLKNIHDDELEDFLKKWNESNVPAHSSLPEP